MTGKMKAANPLSSRLVWETCLSEFKSLGKIASRAALERAQKMIYIATHAKLERRDFSSEEEKDAKLFAMFGSEDGMLAEVYADAPLV
ncbi:uncharacterized protein HKW66_Vig0230360 [Vigna angularis]|uniref:Uncharacterized protein n=1 Tax=Phaseolus angularis TaxID=3914 RepID=A0A8T0KB02_PHAAN|nr:uncharacterized protein HKW66_Vig0230360 [Vigna angularis]